MMNSQVVVLVVVATLCGISVAMMKPPFPFKDPIDSCLMACHMCFEQEFLLECANKVCLTNLSAGKPLDKFWAKTCPGLQEFFRRKELEISKDVYVFSFNE